MRPGYGTAVDLYLDAGWIDVLPLPPGKKFPPPPGYTGADARTPTAVDIEEWKRQQQNGNLALHLHDGFVGLDVDHYGDKPGAETLAALTAAWGRLPPTWVSTARPLPSGIRLYAVPPGTELVGIAGEAIEVIQSRHRYLCCWPSTNPKAGGADYRWLAPDGSAADRPPRPEQLPRLPATWVSGLTRKAIDSPVFVANTTGVFEGTDLERAMREVESAPRGAGNGVLNGNAYHLGRLVGARLLDQSTVEAALVDAAVRRGGETEARARAIVESGVGAGKKRPLRVARFEAVNA